MPGGAAQAGILQDLNRRSDPEAVIRLYESGQIATTEAATGEYVKALVRVDRLDSSSLLRTLQVNTPCPVQVCQVQNHSIALIVRWKIIFVCCKVLALV